MDNRSKEDKRQEQQKEKDEIEERSRAKIEKLLVKRDFLEIALELFVTRIFVEDILCSSIFTQEYIKQLRPTGNFFNDIKELRKIIHRECTAIKEKSMEDLDTIFNGLQKSNELTKEWKKIKKSIERNIHYERYLKRKNEKEIETASIYYGSS